MQSAACECSRSRRRSPRGGLEGHAAELILVVARFEVQAEAVDHHDLDPTACGHEHPRGADVGLGCAAVAPLRD